MGMIHFFVASLRVKCTDFVRASSVGNDNLFLVFLDFSIEVFNEIGGIDDSPDFQGELVEDGEVFPVVPPALGVHFSEKSSRTASAACLGGLSIGTLDLLFCIAISGISESRFLTFLIIQVAIQFPFKHFFKSSFLDLF